MKKIILFSCAALLAIAGYLFAPPPRHAAAFEAQSTWGGTGGGTANAQTVAIANVQALGDVVGVPLRYIPANDNTGPATISINGLAATNVRRKTNIGLQALSGGELQAGVTTTIVYNGSTIEIEGPVDLTPIGKSVEFRGSATPRGTLIEDGSCVSRTTYAPLFSVIGTNYNACDGTTTFGVPDSRGAAFVALDGQGANGLAGRITTATCATPNAVGLCGHEQATLTASLVPTLTSANTGAIALSVLTTNTSIPNGGGPILSLAGTGGGYGFIFDTNPTFGQQASTGNIAIGGASVTSSGTGGSSVPHPVLNPASFGRRAIKY